MLCLPAYDRTVLPWMRDHGSWEPDEASILRALLTPGMTFVDIGAHVGYFTLLGARAVAPTGRVFAIEPEPRNYGFLRKNVRLNGIRNVRAIRAAAWSRSGRTVLSVSEENSGDHRAFQRGLQPAISVRRLALDHVLPTELPLHVVKSDLQGTDHMALRGMEKAIQRSHPVMLVEFWPPGIQEFGDDPVEVVRFYWGLGYKIQALESGQRRACASEQNTLEAAAAEGGFCTLILLPDD
ncbi:MAG: FkbM family methyltransferase [Actinomycetota bacterium]